MHIEEYLSQIDLEISKVLLDDVETSEIWRASLMAGTSSARTCGCQSQSKHAYMARALGVDTTVQAGQRPAVFHTVVHHP